MTKNWYTSNALKIRFLYWKKDRIAASWICFCTCLQLMHTTQRNTTNTSASFSLLKTILISTCIDTGTYQVPVVPGTVPYTTVNDRYWCWYCLIKARCDFYYRWYCALFHIILSLESSLTTKLPSIVLVMSLICSIFPFLSDLHW